MVSFVLILLESGKSDYSNRNSGKYLRIWPEMMILVPVWYLDLALEYGISISSAIDLRERLFSLFSLSQYATNEMASSIFSNDWRLVAKGSKAKS